MLIINMLVFKLVVTAGLPMLLLVNTDKKMTALTDAQMEKHVEVNTPTPSICLLSPRMNSVE
jgi:hypothetical protein